MSIEEHEILQNACKAGDMGTIAQLVANGLDPRGHEELQKPLEIAAHFGHLDVVEFLLQCGVDVNQEDAIEQAVWVNNLEMVQLLLDHGATVARIYRVTDYIETCPHTRAAIVELLTARLPAGLVQPVLIPAAPAGGF